MALDMKDKELVAIGASIGAGCRPCIDHHIGAGRDARLAEPELARAVEVAEATQRLGAALLTRVVRELLHREESSPDAATQLVLVAASRADELTGLGASIGANCHPLLEEHIRGHCNAA
jgi:AhpD family alkylhydroperoxidase